MEEQIEKRPEKKTVFGFFAAVAFLIAVIILAALFSDRAQSMADAEKNADDTAVVQEKTDTRPDKQP